MPVTPPPPQLQNVDNLINKIDDLISVIATQSRQGFNNGGAYPINPFRNSVNGESMDYSEFQDALNKMAERFKEEIESLEKEKSAAQERYDKATTQEDKNKAKTDIASAEKKIEDAKSRHTQEREGFKSEAKGRAYHDVTGGRSTQVYNISKGMKNFGKSLNMLSGGKGALGKLGSGLAKAGGSLARFAGPVGIAIAVIQKLNEAAQVALNYDTEMTKIQQERDTRSFELQNRLINIAGQKAQLQNETQHQIAMQTIATQAQIAQNFADVYLNGYVNARKASVGSLLDGTKEAAYQAGLDAIEMGGGFQRATINKKYGEEKLARSVGAANQAMAYRTEVLEAQAMLEKSNYQIDASMLDWKENQAKYNMYKGVAELTGIKPIGDITGITGTADAIMANKTAHKEQVANFNKLSKEMQFHLLETNASILAQNAQFQAEALNAQTEAIQTVENKINEAAEAILKLYYEVAKKTANLMDDFDDLARTTLSGMGFFDKQSALNYEYAMISTIMPTLAKKWGKKLEDVLAMQEQYSSASGRSIFLSQKDYDKGFALSMMTGSDEITAEIAANAQVFGHSFGDTAQKASEALDDARKSGLDLKKASKDMAQNMKMAEKIQFKGGVKGAMQMSIWAQKTRFDMQSLEAAIDKIQTDGLASVIDTSARLQVLGGGFAAGSNPFSLLYNSYQDPQELAKTYNEMLDGIGSFDKFTGEVKFATAEMIKMNEFAKLTGQNIEDVRNQARGKVQGNLIDDYLKQQGLDGKFNDKMLDLIKQQAHWNDAEQKWQYTDYLGNTKNIEDITESDMPQLLPHDQAVEEYLNQIVSFMQTQFGEDYSQNLKIATETFEQYLQLKQEMMETSIKNFTRKHEEITQAVITSYQLMAASYEGFCERATVRDEQIEKQQTKILESAMGIASTMVQAKTEMDAALQKIQTAASQALVTLNNEDTASAELQKFRSILRDKFGWNNNEIMKALRDNGNEYLYKDAEAVKAIEALRKTPALRAGMGELELAYLARWNDAGRTQIFVDGGEEEHRKMYNYIKSHQGEYTNRFTNDDLKWMRHNNLSWDHDMVTKPATTPQPVTTGGAGYIPPQSGSDHIVDANNQPLYTAAAKVTHINDGTITQAHPQDVGLFAKPGGPFDKLFNGIFGEIQEVHDFISTPPIGSQATHVLTNLLQQNKQQDNTNTRVYVELQPLEIRGELMLNSKDGQSINIIDEFRNDVELRRQITRIIMDEINRSSNSGRLNYTDDTSYFM